MQKEDFRYREVEKHISTLIDGKALLPGEKLPSLRSLSRQLSVSISTVSQAYLELEKKGSSKRGSAPVIISTQEPDNSPPRSVVLVRRWFRQSANAPD